MHSHFSRCPILLSDRSKIIPKHEREREKEREREVTFLFELLFCFCDEFAAEKYTSLAPGTVSFPLNTRESNKSPEKKETTCLNRTKIEEGLWLKVVFVWFMTQQDEYKQMVAVSFFKSRAIGMIRIIKQGNDSHLWL